MNRKISIVFFVICAVVIYSQISFSELPAIDLQSQIADLQTKIDNLTADVNDLQNQFIEFQTNPQLKKKTAKELYEEKRQRTRDRVEYFKLLTLQKQLDQDELDLKKNQNNYGRNRSVKRTDNSGFPEKSRNNSTKIYSETTK